LFDELKAQVRVFETAVKRRPADAERRKQLAELNPALAHRRRDYFSAMLLDHISSD
jgi:hypothetical protein